MLLASGWALLLPALWGYRRGSSWLWWSFLVAGLAAYSAAVGVHYAVGYESLKHLLPALGGLVLFLLGLILSYPFLCKESGAGAKTEHISRSANAERLTATREQRGR
jgi:dihydroorotate dehydrogenase